MAARHSTNEYVEVVEADFARKLKREHDEAQNLIKVVCERHNEMERERDQLRTVCDAMARQYHHEMMSMFGHAADCDCSRCEPMVNLYNSLPHVIERNKAK